jgi:hypothetical protein
MTFFIRWAEVPRDKRSGGCEERKAGRERALALMRDGVARTHAEIAMLANCTTTDAGNALRVARCRHLAGGLYQLPKN